MVNIKKRNKLISIIIPCHNCSKYIRRTIDSIISQEWQSKNGTMGKICDDNNIEIIMIDDCSDDNCQTKNELKRISKDYSIVKCIYLDENKGQAEARNIGLRLARGQYLGFVDADDTINPGLFLEIQKQLNKNNNYTFDILIWGNKERIYNEKDNLIKKYEIVPKRGQFEDNTSIMNLAIELDKVSLFGYLWNKLYKATVIDFNVGIPNEHLIEDILFNIICFNRAKNIICIDKPFYNYNRRESNMDSVTNVFLEDYFDQHYRRVEEFYSWFKSQGFLSDEHKKYFAAVYLRYTISAVWRNNNKKPAMKLEEKKAWVKKYYELPLTKDLVKFGKPSNPVLRFLKNSILKQKTNRILFVGNSMNFLKKYANNVYYSLKFKRN